MKFLSVLTLIFVPLAASAAIISGNDVFNDPTQSLDVFVCYGYLSAQGYKTLGDLPRYPYVTASTLVRSPYSPYCGSHRFSEFDFVTNAHGSPLPQALASVLHTRTRPSMRW